VNKIKKTLKTLCDRYVTGRNIRYRASDTRLLFLRFRLVADRRKTLTSFQRL
jgi:hypothetical protein